MTLSTDSFNRTNSTTNLGATDGAGTLDPLTWVQQISTWGINANQAYCSTAPGEAVATVDLLTADIDISITAIQTNSAPGITFRYSNTTNFWFWKNASTDGGTTIKTQLWKKVAGAYTQVGTDQTGGAANDVLRLVANSSTILCYRNGTLKITATDSFNSTQTKHGMYIGNTVDRLDSWTASPLVTTTATGSQAEETDTARTGTFSAGFPSPGDRVSR